MLKTHKHLIIFCILFLFSLSCRKSEKKPVETIPTDTTWLVLEPPELLSNSYHTKHYEMFGKYVEGLNNGINSLILKGIDIVQAYAMDGGGYFTGINAVPTESPVYYNLKLFDRPLIEVPRHSSYCSGATYTAFIEAMNMLYQDGATKLSEERYEALRMQEPDGSRREDHIKFWGHWNADGFGNHFALIQYANMGTVVKPEEARPGDFANISWKSGLGHSVIFLCWATDNNNDKKIVYWSSQKATNGYGDQIISLQKVKSIKIVRLTNPENIFNFEVHQTVTLDVPGDSIKWETGE